MEEEGGGEGFAELGGRGVVGELEELSRGGLFGGEEAEGKEEKQGSHEITDCNRLWGNASDTK